MSEGHVEKQWGALLLSSRPVLGDDGLSPSDVLRVEGHGVVRLLHNVGVAAAVTRAVDALAVIQRDGGLCGHAVVRRAEGGTRRLSLGAVVVGVARLGR